MQVDNRTTVEHMAQRCMLNRKPYQDKSGRWKQRHTCTCGTNRTKGCNLTRQPDGTRMH